MIRLKYIGFIRMHFSNIDSKSNKMLRVINSFSYPFFDGRIYTGRSTTSVLQTGKMSSRDKERNLLKLLQGLCQSWEQLHRSLVFQSFAFFRVNLIFFLIQRGYHTIIKENALLKTQK